MESIENMKKNESFQKIVKELAVYLWENKHLMQYGTDYEKAMHLGWLVLDSALEICHSKFLVELRRKGLKKR